ncbi:hypothetical protein AQUCO_00300753v1 [Aquilegia coerulea]|uniref:Uncharacterized protein n=1 Tax=Aquilegia coerulea TaxID=218851 RepID=A0A2G5F0G8_AQUCA|nr:hypothetical protein AQUCO_00300753v1 [Aquilegia coerulea]
MGNYGQFISGEYTVLGICCVMAWTSAAVAASNIQLREYSRSDCREVSAWQHLLMHVFCLLQCMAWVWGIASVCSV